MFPLRNNGGASPTLFMKGCRLSSNVFCLFIFSLFSNNILLPRYLPVVNVLCHARQFRRTISTRRGKSQRLPWCFHLEPQSFSFVFFFFRSCTGQGLYSVHLFICTHASYHARRCLQLRLHDLVRCGRPTYKEVSMPSRHGP